MKNAFDTKNWKAYYINLEHRTDKKEHIESELRKVGIQAERFIGETDTDIVHFPEIELTNVVVGAPHSSDKYNSSPHSPGNWGCTLSHYSVLKKHLESKDERILAIFEDDAYFSDDFNERLQYLQENCDLEWDIFYLGAWCKLVHDEKTHTKYVWRIRDVIYGTHGYLINPKSLPKIIELVKAKAKETEIIDSIYCYLTPHLKMYALIPGMVSQIKSKSDITISNGNNFAEFRTMYGEHIFVKRLQDFKAHKTNKIYLYFMYNWRSNYITRNILTIMKKYTPSIYSRLKSYFISRENI